MAVLQIEDNGKGSRRSFRLDGNQRACQGINWRISIGICSGQRNNRNCKVYDKLERLSFTKQRRKGPCFSNGDVRRSPFLEYLCCNIHNTVVPIAAEVEKTHRWHNSGSLKTDCRWLGWEVHPVKHSTHPKEKLLNCYGIT